jgi:tRNA threonylcarbamoyladenosine biosynthesis protein TsaB
VIIKSDAVKILALDTSGEVCSVAIAESGKLLAEYNFLHKRHLTERLPMIVNNLLADVGCVLENIDIFAVGIGPGSFTGVRVGVTFAKLWAEVYQKPLVGISSLDILAWQYHNNSNEGIAVITLARKGELVVGFYTPGERESVVKPHLVATENLLSEMRTHFEERSLIIIAESPVLLETLNTNTDVLLCVDTLRASTLAELVWQRVQESVGEGYDDPATLVPLYVALTPVG